MMYLNYGNQTFHFLKKNCITLLKDFGLVLVVVVLLLVPPQILCLKHVF